jgi:hypothetical protein
MIFDDIHNISSAIDFGGKTFAHCGADKCVDIYFIYWVTCSFGNPMMMHIFWV